MAIDLTSWQRIERVIGWAGLNSSAFAAAIGLPNPQPLYKIKAGKNSISREMAECIAERYPAISRSWLLTGEGAMLRPGLRPLPCYHADCTTIAASDSLPEPDCSVLLPDTDDCAFAARTFSSVPPRGIPSGSLLVFRRIEPAEIVSGNICLLCYGHRAVLRRVVRADYPTLRLVCPEEPCGERNCDATLVVRAYNVKFSVQNHSI